MQRSAEYGDTEVGMDKDEIRVREICVRGSSEVGYRRERGERSGAMKYVAVAVAAVIALVTILCIFGFSDEILNSFGGIELGGGDNGEITGGLPGESESSQAEETSEDVTEERVTETDTERGEESIESEMVDGGEDVIEGDLSLAERGASYLINYTDREVDAEGILEMGFRGGRYSYTEQPVVMILHTHTSEGYYDLDESNPLHTVTKSVVAVGEVIATELNRRGIPTVHCAVIHDGDGADPYESAEDTIETMLRIYPTIEYIIDLHRMAELDGDGNLLRLLSENGKAQMRITVSGEGRRVRDTLALAMSLRRELNRDGSRLCMPTVFTDNEYNSTLAAYYLKVDVGTLGNLADEALSAGESFAKALAEILKK